MFVIKFQSGQMRRYERKASQEEEEEEEEACAVLWKIRNKWNGKMKEFKNRCCHMHSQHCVSEIHGELRHLKFKTQNKVTISAITEVCCILGRFHLHVTCVLLNTVESNIQGLNV
jgi:hypothetical protein